MMNPDLTPRDNETFAEWKLRIHGQLGSLVAEISETIEEVQDEYAKHLEEHKGSLIVSLSAHVYILGDEQMILSGDHAHKRDPEFVRSMPLHDGGEVGAIMAEFESVWECISENIRLSLEAGMNQINGIFHGPSSN